MDSSSSSSKNSTRKHIRFNVGGKIYQVSRSLLEQYPDTMLTRFASEMWSAGFQCSNKEGEADVLFIERDSERFRYCLDYMRDAGNVSLPASASKGALLQDLAYYGFDNVDPSKIKVNVSAGLHKACTDHMDAYVETLETNIKTLETAKYCIEYYKCYNSLRIPINESTVYRFVFMDEWESEFNEMLEPVGLKFGGFEFDNKLQWEESSVITLTTL